MSSSCGWSKEMSVSGPEVDARDRVTGSRVRWDRAERAFCYVRRRGAQRNRSLEIEGFSDFLDTREATAQAQ